ncbi:triacylglycerol lipase 2-like [Ipomoea triloba]|uniref:triacylglycerol lipase 2-like n=1 Tax=Ipomoea triloba TaxID=35885 RepID=UPI00125E78E2|nr:triacylglycerol lipase 2-like [Ipomoea triloba]
MAALLLCSDCFAAKILVTSKYRASSAFLPAFKLNVQITSSLTGPITVDDVIYEQTDENISCLFQSDNVMFRRLTFQRTESLVQSEAVLTSEGSQKNITDKDQKKNLRSKSRKKGSKTSSDAETRIALVSAGTRADLLWPETRAPADWLDEIQDYWEWSWDELVAYDLPATLQYVHDQTGQDMHYVGHSLRTLIAFSALSEHKLLNLLRSAALLSPIAYLAQLRSSIAKFGANAYITERGCQNCCVNSSRTVILLEHEPQSTATKNLIHIAQMVREGSITMYDYGSENENNKHYGQSSPPAYAMANIPDDFPLFLSYGGQDYLSDVNDIKILLDQLHNHNGDKLLVKFIEDYAHADFVFGVNAKQLVYDDVTNFFQDY